MVVHCRKHWWNQAPEFQKPANSTLCQRKSGHNDHIWQESQGDNQSSSPHRDLSDCLVDDDILRGEVVGKLTKVWTYVTGNDGGLMSRSWNQPQPWEVALPHSASRHEYVFRLRVPVG